MIIIHHPETANYARPGHPERPSRVRETEAFLRGGSSPIEWRRASPADDETIRLAHTEAHLRRLEQPRDFDGDTPYYEGIAAIARLATGAVLQAAELAAQGHPTFALMRPPGHHALPEQAMGFCYLNHVAIAALRARASGFKRVAVWDFDAHHGNGTEAILRGREGTLVVSVHQYPGYPGTGTETVANCHNFPVAPGTPAGEHRDILQRAWGEILRFEPDLLLVSAGFDAYQDDPITDMCLQLEDFLALGHWMHEADLPAAGALEGGYSDELPRLVGAFLEAWSHG